MKKFVLISGLLGFFMLSSVFAFVVMNQSLHAHGAMNEPFIIKANGDVETSGNNVDFSFGDLMPGENSSIMYESIKNQAMADQKVKLTFTFSDISSNLEGSNSKLYVNGIGYSLEDFSTADILVSANSTGKIPVFLQGGSNVEVGPMSFDANIKIERV